MVMEPCLLQCLRVSLGCVGCSSLFRNAWQVAVGDQVRRVRAHLAAFLLSLVQRQQIGLSMVGSLGYWHTMFQGFLEVHTWCLFQSITFLNHVFFLD